MSKSKVNITASFSVGKSGRRVDGGYAIYDNALLFKAGDYPDKNYSMSPEDIWAAIDGFTPVFGNIQHSEFLKGRACEVQSIRFDENDSRLMRGTVAVPLGLDDLLDDKERQVSCEWNRATKGLSGVSLVVNPRVPGASLISTFSEMAETDAGLDDRFLAAFTHRKKHDHTSSVHQLVHDTISMGYPGVCSGGPMRPPGAGPGDMDAPAMMALEAMFADHPEQLKALKEIHKTTTMNGAVCGSGKVKMSEKPITSRSVSMSTDADIEITDAEVTDFVTNSPEYQALLARAEKAEKVAAEREAKFAADAEAARVAGVETAAFAFADAEIAAGRSTTFERTDLVLFYLDAADTDHKLNDVVTFSDAKGEKATGTRVEKLKAREAKRSSHGLFIPALGDGELTHDGERVLFNSKANDTARSDREAADAALAKTNDGQAALARRKAAK
jgi:hypothetical protein